LRSSGRDCSGASRNDIAASTGGLRRLRRPLAERDRDVHALTVAQDGERGLVARVLVVLDIAPQVAAGRYRLAIDGPNAVAAGGKDLVADADALRTRLDAGLLRASRHHLHQQSLLIGRKAELLLDLRTQIGQRDAAYAHQRMAVAAGLNELRGHAFDDVDRNREADAFVPPRLRQD